jgi:hypothetical protein
MSHPSRLKNTQGSLQSGMPPSNSETWGRFCDGLGSNIVVQYSVGPIITLHGRIAAREYVDMLGNQVQPMIQTLFPNNAVFLDDHAPIHTAGTVQSWFEEHEDELQHLPWPAQSADLNIMEPVWSVLEARVKNRFPPPTSLKQLEDVHQEEWYKILLETIQTATSPIQERLRLCWRPKVVQHNINKDMCGASVVFPLFCSTSIPLWSSCRSADQEILLLL